MNKKIIITISLIIISIMINLFIYNDDFLYKTPIMKITKITNINKDTEYNNLGISETITTKKIEGTITNGKLKNQKTALEYEESYSSIVTDKYRVGDKVFLKNNTIDNLKRDFYLSLMISLFIIAIFIVGYFKGLLSVVSVILNIIVFYLGLTLYFKGVNLLIVCLLESIIFASMSLIIADGYNRKTRSAIISALTATIILVVMSWIISKVTNYNGISFNELKFLTVPPEDVIIPSVLLGALGAIMDVAITISAAIAELIEKNSKISEQALVKSSKEIGKDIMSTMINVLFFTYFCGGLPIFVLAMRNGYSLYQYIINNLSLELTRFLTGSIGIIITIPITTFICIHLFKRGDINE